MTGPIATDLRSWVVPVGKFFLWLRSACECELRYSALAHSEEGWKVIREDFLLSGQRNGWLSSSWKQRMFWRLACCPWKSKTLGAETKSVNMNMNDMVMSCSKQSEK
jgi:hypothetical protein